MPSLHGSKADVPEVAIGPNSEIAMAGSRRTTRILRTRSSGQLKFTSHDGAPSDGHVAIVGVDPLQARMGPSNFPLLSVAA